MDLNFTEEELRFRDEVRAFFRAEYPQDILRRTERGEALGREDYVRSQKALYEKGWAAPNWPVEHGGTGWTATQKYIFEDEMGAAGAPRVIPFGLNMVAPVIYTYGNEAQKKRFLPDILASNVWWCQGYSEPGAGSDLASLKTKAVRKGDTYVVNGTKTWTTMAQWADWIFCLVRTDSSGTKQEGISFLLIDMTTPGVTVRPIITLEGHHEVNEVHFEDVEVPAENLIGEEGKGWTYAKMLLTHERTGIAGVARSKRELRRLKEIAAEIPAGDGTLMDDAGFRERTAKVELELSALEFTELRVLGGVATGRAPGPESSILKIKGTEVQQAITELFVEAAGAYAMPFQPERFEPGWNGEPVGPEFAALTAPSYFNMRKVTIYGGSNEIQKNIIAKAVLGF